MAKKPSTQASARATSGSLEVARQKSRRLFNKAAKTKAGTDHGTETNSKWWTSVKDERALEKKQRQARRKVK